MGSYKIYIYLIVGVFILANAVRLTSTGNAIVKYSKLKFSFYITSKCEDTINFIRDQLYPVYKDLHEYLEVEFIPWGKSRRTDDGSVSCQFGDDDCTSNKIQSCALSLISDQHKQVEYMNCESMTLASTVESFRCVLEAGVDEVAAKECVRSELGDKLQAIAEDKTKTVVMVFVPTIVLNDEYNAEVQDAAFDNFKKYVCEILDTENPACKHTVHIE